MPQVIYSTKPNQKARAIQVKLEQLLAQSPLDLDRPLVIAIGGDGTMLQAIKEHIALDPLYVGVSAGKLGFLQAVEPDELEQLVEALRDGSYHLMQAPLLGIRQAGTDSGVYGFNDISIERSGPRAAKFGLHVGGSAGHFVGDGVIFSTPLGSTAYALAAGGPVIDSCAQDVFLVTPNNPHMSVLYSSLQRPHILASKRTVQLTFSADDIADRPLKLVCDGHTIPIDFTQDLEIFLSDKSVSLMELARDGWQSHIESMRLGRN